MKARNFWLGMASVAMICTSSSLLAKSEAVGGGYYTPDQKEFYLAPDQIFFIRPGLELEIMDVTIPGDMQPEVTFKLTDPGGLPLDRNGVFTPGPVSTSWILSYIPAGETAYVAYTTRVQTSPITNNSAIQAGTDSGGTYTELGMGEYRYKFGTVLPMEYNPDLTHTLGVYARRDLREFDLDRYVTNELEHFVPSGMGTATPRDIVTTDTCNNCHDPLAIHGGSRQEVGLCILCHNPTQSIDPDTGNSVDMPLMVHKIHYGAELENGYTIIGYNQGVHDYSHFAFPEGAEVNDCEICHVGGTPTEDFPLVATPNPVPVCDGSSVGVTELTWDYEGMFEIRVGAEDGGAFATADKPGMQTTGKWVGNNTRFYMVDTTSGETVQMVDVDTTVLGCVGNAPGTYRGKPGAQHTNWLSNPSIVACGACHDDVVFDTGEGHGPDWVGPRTDEQCSLCHRPDSGDEFDRSIRGTHTPEYKSAQLAGVIVDIMDIRNTAPGQAPTVTFAVSSKYGSVNPNSLDRLRFAINGPNEDWDVYIQEEAVNSSYPNGDYWDFTFIEKIPMDATGSYTLSFEARAEPMIEGRDGPVEVRDVAEPPQFPFTVTDMTPKARRMVVDDAKCESCHSNLAGHGGGRRDVQYCGSCHMPQAVAERAPQENYGMKWMVHKIHRGEDLENGYTVVRSRGTFSFDDVVYVGDLRNCEACHVNDSHLLPLPAGLLDAPVPQALYSPMQAATAACLSCHDSDDAGAHADANTGFFGETCNTCHGDGKSFSVERVHAR